MIKVLTLSDDGLSSGFGRIAMTLNIALVKRGYNVMAASIQYDGLLPPTYEGDKLPYWVAALGGKSWPDELMKLANVFQPDVVFCVQDAPYGLTIRNMPIDWSKVVFVNCTPVDGTPIHPTWVDMMRKADAALTISEFGVKAYREAGVNVGLCRPGIDANVFYRMRDDDRLAMRTALGVDPNAFIVGMFAMNQGRKNFPDTLRAFYRFAADKPTARLLLDCEPVSPAGWDIPAVCQQWGWDASKLIFREQAIQRGLTHLRERYNILDVHSVLAHREGFGLPLLESMACGVVTAALDWCSGTELVGDGRGLLIKPIAYSSIGTWGGAQDKFPDVDHMVSELQRMHDYPHERAALAQRGMEWARGQSWIPAIDTTVNMIEAAVSKRQAQIAQVAAQLAASQQAASGGIPANGGTLVSPQAQTG